MCGRFEGVDETWEQLYELLENFAQLPSDTAARYTGREIRPTNKYPIIVNAPTGGYEIIEARWSLVPFFFKDALKAWKATTFNAKIEEAAAKPSFRGPWKNKHCLVPVRSFWEWSGEHPTEPKKKQRYCVTRGDNHPMVLAGLWDRAKTMDGEVTSFTILTRGPGEDMARLHNREPVMLDPDQWRRWQACEAMPELVHPASAGLYRTAPELRVFAQA
jgi:putative SOS response-associated peptidase YedK